MLVADLDGLRATLSNDQRSILDYIWHTYHENKGNTWPTVQDVQVDFEKPRVTAALEGLRSGIVYVEKEQYRIELLGILLTTNGDVPERLLAEYLSYVRETRRRDRSAKVFKSKEVARALQLSEEQIPVLASTIHLARLGGDRGAGGGPIWAAGMPDDIAEIMIVPDLRAYVRDRAIKMAEDLASARGLAPTVQESRFWFVENLGLRALLEADFEELSLVRSVRASKSSVLLAGGILEGMLLDVLARENRNRLESAVRALEARGVISRKPPNSLDDWLLIHLVAVAGQLRIIPSSATHLSHALREFRNLVHPGKHLREGIALTENEGSVSTQILDICINAIASYEEGKACPPG